MDPRGDVDAVTDELVLIHDHVFDIDADTQGQLGGVSRRILMRQRTLRIERPGDRSDRARELDENGITGDFQDAPAVLADPWLEDVGAQRFPCAQGVDIVLLDHARPARNVREHNRGEASRYGDELFHAALAFTLTSFREAQEGRERCPRWHKHACPLVGLEAGQSR